MRKLKVLEHISLDGVIQGPGGPEEDPSGGFTHGGWISQYSDDVSGTELLKQMNSQFDIILGRTTFEIWEPYWPLHPDVWPNVNTATKFIASNTRSVSDWKPSVFLSGDVAAKVAEIKKTDGPDLHIWGSSNLLQTLIKHDLVDVCWLMIYPITLGIGKRLFAEGSIPAAYKVTESVVNSKGMIIVNYERAGDIITVG